MKRLFSFVGVMGTVLLASAQLTGISIENVFEHNGTVGDIPAGYTTYRIYAQLTNELDFVSAIYGDDSAPMSLQSTGNIYQTPLGGLIGTDINSAFFFGFPELEYDSWFTVDAEFAGDGLGEIGSAVAPGSQAFTDFENGQGFLVNDAFGASWFTTFACAQELDDLTACAEGRIGFAGDDLKVLIAQITTNGDLTGIFNLQVFPNGIQAEAAYNTGLTFSSSVGAVFGCTDEDATNYDNTATEDDGSCTYPCALQFIENSLTVTSPTCAGGNDGAIQIQAEGAQISDDFYIDNNPIAQNFGNFSVLVSGLHTLYVYDGAGCVDSLEVDIPATAPLVITAELTTPVTCHNDSDGEITISGTTGGSGDYEYSISSNPGFTSSTTFSGLGGDIVVGAVYQFVVQDVQTGCISEPQPSTVQTGAPANTPGVYVSNPTPVNVFLGQAGVPADLWIGNATCFDQANGEIYLTATGGSNLGFEYSVDGINYAPSPIPVSGGTFSVMARESNGCMGTLEDDVVVGPDPIVVNAAAQAETCVGDNNGEVSWTPTGGTGAYTYTVDEEVVTGVSAAGLEPGTYDVTVTDANTCSVTETVEVEAAVAINVSTSVTDASCFGGNDGVIVVNATGGSGTFQYSEDGTNYLQNNEFTGLTAGAYTVFVQDQFGCIENGSATVGEAEEIVVTATISTGSATGEGTIDVFVEGGTLPFEYEWIGEGVSGLTTQDLDSISTGTYIVEVTDANGCSTVETFDITTDIREIEAGVIATVYPNPSQGLFTVDIVGGFQGQVQYFVVDARGRQFTSGQWNGLDGFFRTQLDLSNAEAGMYRLVMLANGRPTSMQLVKTQ